MLNHSAKGYVFRGQAQSGERAGASLGVKKYVITKRASAPAARIESPRTDQSTCRNPGIVAPKTAIAKEIKILASDAMLGSANGWLRMTTIAMRHTTITATDADTILSQVAGR